MVESLPSTLQLDALEFVMQEIDEGSACFGAQFSALPGALTGREVLRLYARLRGVPADMTEATVEQLLQRIDLAEYADRWDGVRLACKRTPCRHSMAEQPLLEFEEGRRLPGMGPGAWDWICSSLTYERPICWCLNCKALRHAGEPLSACYSLCRLANSMGCIARTMLRDL